LIQLKPGTHILLQHPLPGIPAGFPTNCQLSTLLTTPFNIQIMPDKQITAKMEKPCITAHPLRALSSRLKVRMVAF